MFKKITQADIDKYHKNLSNNNELMEGITADDYLEFCKICYLAVDVEESANEKSAKDLYLSWRMLSENDECSGRLVHFEPNTAEHFKEWIERGYGYPFHCFEIIFGRVELECRLHKDKFFFYLYCHADWDKNNIKLVVLMYNALVEKGIPVICKEYAVDKLVPEEDED